MQLTEFYNFDIQLKANPGEEVTLVPKGSQTLAKGHKAVIALASLSGYDEHSFLTLATTTGNDTYQTTLPGKAVVLFNTFVQNGKTNTANSPTLVGGNITTITWTFDVVSCWARASVIILAFD